MKGQDISCKGPVPQDMLEILMNGIFAFAMTIIVKNNIPLPSGNVSEDIYFFIEFFYRFFLMDSALFLLSSFWQFFTFLPLKSCVIAYL